MYFFAFLCRYCISSADTKEDAMSLGVPNLFSISLIVISSYGRSSIYSLILFFSSDMKASFIPPEQASSFFTSKQVSQKISVHFVFAVDCVTFPVFIDSVHPLYLWIRARHQSPDIFWVQLTRFQR